MLNDIYLHAITTAALNYAKDFLSMFMYRCCVDELHKRYDLFARTEMYFSDWSTTTGVCTTFTVKFVTTKIFSLIQSDCNILPLLCSVWIREKYLKERYWKDVLFRRPYFYSNRVWSITTEGVVTHENTFDIYLGSYRETVYKSFHLNENSYCQTSQICRDHDWSIWLLQ